MDSKEIGSRILTARKKLGYTQRQLGELISVSDKAVSKWERGIGCPDISLLLPLSEALHMTIDELIGGNIVEKNEQKTIQNIITYTRIKTKENKERIIKLSYIFITIAMLLGIMITSLCDYLLNQDFTWSLICIAAIVYAWLIITTLVSVKKNAFVKAIIVASIGVFPLLYVIANQLYNLQWFYQQAVIIALFSNVYVYLIIWIWYKTSWKIWYKVGSFVYLSIIVNIPSNYLSGLSYNGMLINLICNIIIGSLVMFYAVMKDKEQYNDK